MAELIPKNALLSKESERGYLLYCAKKGLYRCEFTPPPLKNENPSKIIMKIHPEGRIHAGKQPTFEHLVNRINIEKEGIIPENAELIKRFIYDARIGKTCKGKQKTKIGIRRIQKYIHDLKKIDSYFKKPLDKVTSEDMERFILDLEEGRITTNKNKPYAQETQIVIKKIIKKFYKWVSGSKYPPDFVDWIDTSIELKEYKSLRKEQIDEIINNLVSTKPLYLIRNKAIIKVLFDSGLRAEELLNIRMKHTIREEDNYKIRVEFSKTKRRTITLPMCKECLDQWLNIHPLKDNPEAQLFPINYNNLRMMIKRSGAFINENISPHTLRHSSATYWCKHLTKFELCYRFGWGMNSNMPERYIDREGLNEEKASKIIKATNMEKLEEENSRLNRRLSAMEDQLNKLFGSDFDEVKRIIERVKSI